MILMNGDHLIPPESQFLVLYFGLFKQKTYLRFKYFCYWCTLNKSERRFTNKTDLCYETRNVNSVFCTNSENNKLSYTLCYYCFNKNNSLYFISMGTLVYVLSLRHYPPLILNHTLLKLFINEGQCCIYLSTLIELAH